MTPKPGTPKDLELAANEKQPHVSHSPYPPHPDRKGEAQAQPPPYHSLIPHTQAPPSTSGKPESEKPGIGYLSKVGKAIVGFYTSFTTAAAVRDADAEERKRQKGKAVQAQVQPSWVSGSGPASGTGPAIRRASSSSSSSSSLSLSLSSSDDFGSTKSKPKPKSKTGPQFGYTGNFTATSSNVRLEVDQGANDCRLVASCLSPSGEMKRSSIQLNDLLENCSGKFTWYEGGNFMATAACVRLGRGGKYLEADLSNGVGVKDFARIRLDERIANVDGVLTFVPRNVSVRTMYTGV